MLTIATETLDDVVILHCLGRIVCAYESILLCSALHQAGRNIILDLAQVDVIDAAGIGALVSLQAAGIYLRLVNPTQPVREILRVTNLDSVFEICESRGICEMVESATTVDRTRTTRSFIGL
ncbi:MAG: STAS domain-containing protein [Candidatus Sulfotelmatobacter sp.]|jgi:anti-anti-sigma factor